MLILSLRLFHLIFILVAYEVFIENEIPEQGQSEVIFLSDNIHLPEKQILGAFGGTN